MAIAGIDEARIRRAFLEEAEELCQKLGDSLLALEADRGNISHVNEVFRLTHSLKSESALMGFVALSELAHKMEDVLGIAREGRVALEKPVMDAIFAGSDLIAEMMAAIAKGGNDTDFDTSGILRDLSQAAAVGGQPSGEPAAPEARRAVAEAPDITLDDFERRQLTEARDRGEVLYRLTVNVDESEPMKFPRMYLVFYNLELAANVVKVAPPMDGEPDDDARYAATTVLLTSAAGEDNLRAAAAVDQIAWPGWIDRTDLATAPGARGSGRRNATRSGRRNATTAPGARGSGRRNATSRGGENLDPRGHTQA
jgi:chemotaxis protein histidine kinase CheA